MVLLPGSPCEEAVVYAGGVAVFSSVWPNSRPKPTYALATHILTQYQKNKTNKTKKWFDAKILPLIKKNKKNKNNKMDSNLQSSQYLSVIFTGLIRGLGACWVWLLHLLKPKVGAGLQFSRCSAAAWGHLKAPGRHRGAPSPLPGTSGTFPVEHKGLERWDQRETGRPTLYTLDRLKLSGLQSAQQMEVLSFGSLPLDKQHVVTSQSPGALATRYKLIPILLCLAPPE